MGTELPERFRKFDKRPVSRRNQYLPADSLIVIRDR